MRLLLMFRATLVALLALTGLRSQVTAHYINVGQAASALLEFSSGAILIDAGGENTGDDVYRSHLSTYLNDFFSKSRPDLNRTLEGVVISHPHIDHTMYLMDVMQNFTVHALVDNGSDSGSGMPPLKKARDFAKAHHIPYFAIRDAGIHQTGKTLSLIEPGESGTPKIVLLSGSRGCDNPNNDSIAVRIETVETVLLFTGDAENEDKVCSPELSVLGEKYGQTPLLRAQIYHIAHHGSFNGTTDAFMKLVTPTIAVISAGDPTREKPGIFHAFQYGHPREEAVATIVADTSAARTDFGGGTKDVTIFPKVKETKTISMSKAVYCTCWDGDIRVVFAKGQTIPAVATTDFHPPIH